MRERISLYLIRHGQSHSNAIYPHIIGSDDDSPLTRKGEMQARLLGYRLNSEIEHVHFAYASTAKRSYDTARIALAIMGYGEERISRSEKLLEIRRGEWKGKNRERIHTPDVLRMMDENPYDFAPPKGESQRQVEERMKSWLEETIATSYGWFQSELPTCIVHFGHGYAIKSLVRGLLNIDPGVTYRLEIENTGITRLVLDDKNKWCLKSWNDSAHLIGLSAAYKRTDPGD